MGKDDYTIRDLEKFCEMCHKHAFCELVDTNAIDTCLICTSAMVGYKKAIEEMEEREKKVLCQVHSLSLWYKILLAKSLAYVIRNQPM